MALSIVIILRITATMTTFGFFPEGAPPPLRLINFGPTGCGLRPRRQPNPFISSPTTKTP
jgi:hypothetical protein